MLEDQESATKRQFFDYICTSYRYFLAGDDARWVWTCGWVCLCAFAVCMAWYGQCVDGGLCTIVRVPVSAHLCSHIYRVGQNRIYTPYIYAVYDRIFDDFPAKNAVYKLYTLYIWFWPTLHLYERCRAGQERIRTPVVSRMVYIPVGKHADLATEQYAYMR